MSADVKDKVYDYTPFVSSPSLAGTYATDTRDTGSYWDDQSFEIAELIDNTVNTKLNDANSRAKTLLDYTKGGAAGWAGSAEQTTATQTMLSKAENYIGIQLNKFN